MTDQILTVENLKKHFVIDHSGIIKPVPITVKAVDGVSFSIQAGETFGLVGESGSGKSTVAYITVGMYQPTDGTIYFRGQDLFTNSKERPLAYKKEIQIVFQDPEEATLVLDRNGLKVYAFPVNHEPASPAVGYRFEYTGNVVVITGDTKKTDKLAEYARDADILISEVLSFDLVRMTVDSLTRLGLERAAGMIGDVLDYHMDPVQVGEVARDAGVKKLVFTHVFPPAPDILDLVFTLGTKEAYSGEVIMGEDGMFFTLDAKN